MASSARLQVRRLGIHGGLAAWSILIRMLTVVVGFEENCGVDGNPPCMIYTFQDLKNIERTGLNKSYMIMKDIYAAPGENFVPIGGYDNIYTEEIEGYPFTGVLEGNGHSIYNLNVGRNDLDYQGLFGHVSGKAEIRNIVFQHPRAIARRGAGVLAGVIVGDATVNNVWIKRPAVTTATYHAGGLVGFAGGGTVSCCHVIRGAVRSLDTYSSGRGIGGLVGGSGDGTRLSECTVVGTHVFGKDREITDGGGLVGSMNDGIIENCYANATVHGVWKIGGLVGFAEDTEILNSYAVGNTSASFSEVGGLVGRATAYITQPNQDIGSAAIKNCFTAGLGDERRVRNDGGLVGEVGYPGQQFQASPLLQNNYCTEHPPLGSRRPLKNESIKVVWGPKYFSNAENEPMVGWDSDIWEFKKNQYPNLVCRQEANTGGPYVGKLGESILLDRSKALRGASYLWTAENKNCFFDNDKLLHPVLSCVDVDPGLVVICLKASFADNRVLQNCTTVVMESDVEVLVVGTGGPYSVRIGRPLHLSKAYSSLPGSYHWKVDSGDCSFSNEAILHPMLTCQGAAAVVNVCLTVNRDDSKAAQACTTVSVQTPQSPRFPQQVKYIACDYHSCVARLIPHHFDRRREFGDAQATYDEAKLRVKYAARLIDYPKLLLTKSVRRLSQAMSSIEELRNSAPGFSNGVGDAASRCAIILLRDFRRAYKGKGILSEELLDDVRDRNLKVARAKAKSKHWKKSVTQSHQGIWKMMHALGEEKVPTCAVL